MFFVSLSIPALGTNYEVLVADSLLLSASQCSFNASVRAVAMTLLLLSAVTKVEAEYLSNKHEKCPLALMRPTE